jgi:hypothetical protein
MAMNCDGIDFASGYCVLCRHCLGSRFTGCVDREKKKEEKWSQVVGSSAKFWLKKYDEFYTKLFEFQLLRV